MAKLSDDDLIAAVEAEEQSAINWADGPLAEHRAEAWRRFNSEPFGNEVEGRSQVVTSNVRDAVMSCMPSLARVFLSGDEIGKFDPIGPGDEKAAEVETEAVNHYLMVKNPGFEILYNAIQDSLVSANSYVKAWWRKNESVKVEKYEDLSDEELAILLQDPDVRVLEHEAHSEEVEGYTDSQDLQIITAGPVTHDVKLRRTHGEEFVQYCAAPSNEILVSSLHREVSLANADFVQHRRDISIGELRELGYDVPDGIADDTDDASRPESLARQRYDEWSQATDDSSAVDETRRVVTLRETWIKLGDKDGKQTLWRACIVGKTLLHREEADLIPIAAFCPSPYPHSHAGMSLYTMLQDIEEVNTTILRQYLDNLYLSNNGRTVVGPNVNIDDLLVSRPGGIVRTEGVPGQDVMPLITPDVGGAALQAMEMLSQAKENRIGVARINQGQLDANSLNRTATGASMMMSSGQARLELMARCLASGFRDLFLIVHALASKHSTKPLQLRLHDEYVPTNPREWVRRTDFSLSVAMGTGNPEQQMGKLQIVGQWMAQGMQVGIVTPQNLYEWGKEFLRTAGYRSPDKFLTAPQPGQQPPQQQNPLVQVEQIKQQSAHALKDKELAAQAQTGQQEAQQKYELEQQRMANEIAAQNAQAEADSALARAKMEQEAQLEQYKAQLNAETRLKEKLIEIAGNVLAQSMAPEPAEHGEEGDQEAPEKQQMAAIMQALQAMVQTLASAANTPKQIISDSNA